MALLTRACEEGVYGPQGRRADVACRTTVGKSAHAAGRPCYSELQPVCFCIPLRAHEGIVPRAGRNLGQYARAGISSSGVSMASQVRRPGRSQLVNNKTRNVEACES